MKRSLAIGITALFQTSGLAAQVPLDRADPTITQRAVPQPLPAAPVRQTNVSVEPLATAATPLVVVARAITVAGQDQLPAAAFADVIAGSVGQELDRADLARLASAIAEIARTRGFPLASARIEPQPVIDGILRVTLDLGQVDAVRVLGARNATADRILQRTLVTGASLRRDQLERAIALVGDLAGVRVTASRFVRQDGFGILLVTIEQDRVSAYVQVDNRGSDEVGPLRSTVLASVRSVAVSADELALVISQTPLQPSEFVFVRARYSAPVGVAGTTLSLSGSLARSHPGGSLKPLDIVGNSTDASVGLQHPLLRSRARSLWASVQLRALKSDQRLAGTPLRRDRLVTATSAINGAAQIFSGQMRGELAAIAGLPFAWTTRQGSPLASRDDGDAGFVVAAYSIDWTVSLGKPFSLVLASAGQVASRPLLATAEIGLGGPAFGRAYDYAERTGDQGVLGSAELRIDTGGIPGSIFTRVQLYAFFDGGVVGNLRRGEGGGALASTGAGVRVGTGRLDWLVEVASPLTTDRFDTNDRRPRISLRLARSL